MMGKRQLSLKMQCIFAETTGITGCENGLWQRESEENNSYSVNEATVRKNRPGD